MAAQQQQDEVGRLLAKAIPRQERTQIVVSGFLLCVVLLWNYRLLAEKSGQAGWMTSRTTSSQTAKPTGMLRPFCSRSQLQHGRWIQSNVTTEAKQELT